MAIIKIIVLLFIVTIFIFTIPSYIIPDEKIASIDKYDDRSVWFLHFFIK